MKELQSRFSNKDEEFTAEMADFDALWKGTIKERDYYFTELSASFKEMKAKSFNELEPIVTNFITEVKKASDSESKKKEFFDLFEHYPSNLSQLNKILETWPEEYKAFITKELRHVVALMNKNSSIDEIEEKIRTALAGFEIGEIESMQALKKEKNLAIDEQLEAQIIQLYAEIAANPNFIAEKQTELKKNTKGGKPKK